jgi:nucleoside-diphosphate-sugar epimerase
VLPVAESVRHWFASPRAAVAFIVLAAELDTALLGTRRALTMPGLEATVSDQIAALRRVAGDAAVALIRHEPDAKVAAIIAGWPRSFDAARALALGFEAEPSFDAIIRAHVEDELSGVFPLAERA